MSVCAGGSGAACRYVWIWHLSSVTETMPLDTNGLVIVISQSGETADSLAALRLAKEKGLKTLGIVNVVGSSIAREADNVFYTLAGPEIAVATTKAYSTQLIAGYLPCRSVCAGARMYFPGSSYAGSDLRASVSS